MTGWLCAAILCNSAHLQHQLPHYLSPQIIPNGVDSQRFSYNPDPTLRDRLAPQAEHVLLVLGRVTLQKSPYLLAEAIGILKQHDQLQPHTNLWIVGESEDEEGQQQLEEIIRHYDLNEIVRQLPATSTPEAYYHAADITVLASLWEGLPNVILESLAAGKPVIVSKAANAAGVIKQGFNGWVVGTSDVESLAETLRAVFALPKSDLSGMSATCKESAAHFSVSAMVKSYEAIYQRLSVRA